MSELDVETKNIMTDLINKFVDIIKINVFSSKVQELIKESYDKGLENAEIKFNMNFSRSNERLEFLEKYTFDNIKGMNDEIADKLRGELQRGFMNLESVSQIQKRVQKVMDVGVERSRIIARTEINRAENMGHLDGARQSGLKLIKQWDSHLDSRTSAVCKFLDGKKVPIDGKFKWEGQEFDAPPSHPNCRSVLLFIQEDEK